MSQMLHETATSVETGALDLCPGYSSAATSRRITSNHLRRPALYYFREDRAEIPAS